MQLLLLILQEVVQNIDKHAKAKQVWVAANPEVYRKLDLQHYFEQTVKAH